MKIVKIIFFIFLALGLVIGTGIFIFFQTFDADQYLPQIANKVSLVLGRPAAIGHVGLGLSLRGITLDAGPFTVADDANFTSEPFIIVDKVRISVDLRSLILERKIHITKIVLQSPQIHFIRSPEGRFNINSIKKFSSIDNTGITANTRSASPNSMMGKVGQNKGPVENNKWLSPIITLQDASISFIDQNPAFPMDIWLTGINASLSHVSLSQPFQISFDAGFYSDTPNIFASTMVSLDTTKRSISISDFKMLMDFSKLNINELKYISPQMPDSSFLRNISGAVQLNFDHLDTSVSGELEGSGNISITGGVIKNFNIIKMLFSNTLGAFIEGKNIDNLLSGQSKLAARDTVIGKAEAQFSFHNPGLSIDDSLIQTNIFELTAKGSVDQGLNMDMQTLLHLNQDVSADLVNQFPGLKLLCDDSNRIAIDASLKGAIPHLKYKPNKDFRKKSRKALMQEGGNILGILLGGTSTSSQDQDSSSKDSVQKTQKKFKNILKSFLQ